ncbi:unnamed protein product [Pseudo-nitzschia multistriata]|uniref:procollagen-proline 3-dioxygenase n=1 Tax=Pseudo-nitzschia multistriata TaxID=183589 RepID=A0A448ZTG2_9STRA|nr:unnamed protein product [Pseudo-nitzschia multistriata]
MIEASSNLRELFGDSDDELDEVEETDGDDNSYSSTSAVACVEISTSEDSRGTNKKLKVTKDPSPTRRDGNGPRNDNYDSVSSHSSLCYNEWSKRIGICDDVLTPGECDELIAVHESEAHHGYIDHLTVTRISDLVDHAPNYNSSEQTQRHDQQQQQQQKQQRQQQEPLHNAVYLALPLLRARYEVWQAVEDCFPEHCLELLPEFTALTAWHKGSFLENHYDSNRSYLEDRFISAVLYLNDPVGSECGNCNSNDDDDACDLHPENYHCTGFEGGDLVFEVPEGTSRLGANIGCQTNVSTPSDQTLQKHQITHPEKSTRVVTPRAGRLVCFPSCGRYVHRVEKITRGTRYALTMWFTRRDEAMERLQSLFLSQAAANLAPQQQPWETPQQAELLRRRIFLRPKIPLPDKNSLLSETEWRHLIAYCWWKKGIPLWEILSKSFTTETAMTDADIVEGRVFDNSSSRNPGIAMNSSTRTKLQKSESQLERVVREWRDHYVNPRRNGMASAMARWNADGMLATFVKDDEMKCI